MSSKSNIFYNNLKQTDTAVHQNDSVKKKGIQNDILIILTKLKSSFQPPPKTTPTESRHTKFSSIPEKIMSNKLFIFLLSFCLPMSSSCNEANSNNACKPLMICLPSKPNYKPKKKEEQRQPIGMITRSKDVELIAGKIVDGCACGKRDGLSGGDNCPRSCCRNNPGCFMNPPQCWPQFKDPPKPPPIPERKMICIPIELVYYDPS